MPSGRAARPESSQSAPARRKARPLCDGGQVALSQTPRAELQTALRTIPGVLHSLSMITLSQPDLAREVDHALADNPMLQRRSGSPCPGCGAHRRPGVTCVRCTAGSRPARDPSVRPFEALETRAGWEIRADCRDALPIVIAHLTSRGLLDDAPEQIAADHGLPSAKVAEAIRAIKAAGPPGIGERSVRDLLAAQARSLTAAPPWLPALIRDHLEAIAAGDVTGAARALSVPAAEMARAFLLVRDQLRPFAAVPDEKDPARVPPPDVIVRLSGGEYVVDVPDTEWFGLRIAPMSAAVRADPAAAAWLAGYERTARDLLQHLDVRAGVLRRITAFAVRLQAGIFTRGAAAHRPLTRTAVAGELGLHPSTVSRCVAGKTMRTPDGRLLPLADLFGNAVAIKARVAELAAEGNDAQVSRLLAAEGHRVARRTVAKYRAELGIAAHRT